MGRLLSKANRCCIVNGLIWSFFKRFQRLEKKSCSIYTIRSTADHWVENIGNLISPAASTAGSDENIVTARRCVATIPMI